MTKGTGMTKGTVDMTKGTVPFVMSPVPFVMPEGKDARLVSLNACKLHFSV